MKQKQIAIDFPAELSYIEPVVSDIINKIFEDHKVDDFIISVAVVSDEIMSDLNRRFRSTLGTTDVLSFYIAEEPYEGEIYISAEQAMEGSVTDGTSFVRELYKLIIHGTLHLLHYHHDTDGERKLNNELMNRYLKYCE